MFKDVEELKDFITWVKTQKVQSFQIGDVLLHFNHSAFLDAPEQNQITKDVVKDIIKKAQEWGELDPQVITDEELFGK